MLYEKTLPVSSATLGYTKWVWTAGFTGGNVGVVIIVDACCIEGGDLLDRSFLGLFSCGPLIW